MSKDKIKYTICYGFIESDNPNQKNLICSRDLFSDNLFSTTTIKSIKLWFGSPPEKKDIKSLLGIQVKYINYLTGEKKETNYQGAKIEGTDIETKELEIKEGEYLSQFNLIFREYITYIKFGTKNNVIEFGNYNKDNELSSLKELNLENNVILNIKGFMSLNGIRCIGCDYISHKDFFFIRTMDIFILRHRVKKNKKYIDKYSNHAEIDKLNDEMKFFLKICSLPDTPFQKIVKYL